MAKDGKKNVTAWLDEERLSKLADIIEDIGGDPSNSYVLSKLIDDEHERLVKRRESPKNDNLTNIYKVIIAMNKGEKFMDMDSINAFLKGGK